MGFSESSLLFLDKTTSRLAYWLGPTEASSAASPDHLSLPPVCKTVVITEHYCEEATKGQTKQAEPADLGEAGQKKHHHAHTEQTTDAIKRSADGLELVVRHAG